VHEEPHPLDARKALPQGAAQGGKAEPLFQDAPSPHPEDSRVEVENRFSFFAFEIMEESRPRRKRGQEIFDRLRERLYQIPDQISPRAPHEDLLFARD
jgi:hypothetical protein